MDPAEALREVQRLIELAEEQRRQRQRDRSTSQNNNYPYNNNHKATSVESTASSVEANLEHKRKAAVLASRLRVLEAALAGEEGTQADSTEEDEVEKRNSMSRQRLPHSPPLRAPSTDAPPSPFTTEGNEKRGHSVEETRRKTADPYATISCSEFSTQINERNDAMVNEYIVQSKQQQTSSKTPTKASVTAVTAVQGNNDSRMPTTTRLRPPQPSYPRADTTTTSTFASDAPQEHNNHYLNASSLKGTAEINQRKSGALLAPTVSELRRSISRDATVTTTSVAGRGRQSSLVRGAAPSTRDRREDEAAVSRQTASTWSTLYASSINPSSNNKSLETEGGEEKLRFVLSEVVASQQQGSTRDYTSSSALWGRQMMMPDGSEEDIRHRMQFVLSQMAQELRRERSLRLCLQQYIVPMLLRKIEVEESRVAAQREACRLYEAHQQQCKQQGLDPVTLHDSRLENSERVESMNRLLEQVQRIVEPFRAK